MHVMIYYLFIFN